MFKPLEYLVSSACPETSWNVSPAEYMISVPVSGHHRPMISARLLGEGSAYGLATRARSAPESGKNKFRLRINGSNSSKRRLESAGIAEAIGSSSPGRSNFQAGTSSTCRIVFKQ